MIRLCRAFLFSVQGLRASWCDEAAFRLEIMLACALIPLAWLWAPDQISLALMVSVVILVPLVELLNTAIEAALDRMGEEVHPLAKKAKDAGSAAVLLAVVLASVTWLLLLV